MKVSERIQSWRSREVIWIHTQHWWRQWQNSPLKINDLGYYTLIYYFTRHYKSIETVKFPRRYHRYRSRTHQHSHREIFFLKAYKYSMFFFRFFPWLKRRLNNKRQFFAVSFVSLHALFISNLTPTFSIPLSRYIVSANNINIVNFSFFNCSICVTVQQHTHTYKTIA